MVLLSNAHESLAFELNTVRLSETINPGLLRRAMILDYLLSTNQGCSKVTMLNSRGRKPHNGVNTFLQYFL